MRTKQGAIVCYTKPYLDIVHFDRGNENDAIHPGGIDHPEKGGEGDI